MKGIETIPAASRLIKSLRDMGYDFSQAIADIVDNAIEAKANLVAINVEFDGDNSWVRIADNGRGMKPEEVREAMRYGAGRHYDENDLGKFGLGLKTASLSQCQRLSVASRWNTERADITAFSWDMDHIERTNRWEILPLDRNDMVSALRQPLQENTGTVVLWQQLDRVLGYKHPYGEAARRRLSQTCREIEAHLGMVFHRFLVGEVRGKRFKLLLNGNEVKLWDPFCRSEAKTKSLQAITIKVEHEEVSGEVLIEPYVLPHQSDFSSSDAFHIASGPSNWNQQQGLYIYRAGRMIQSGGWSNLRAPDEHTKLARVAVSFSPKLDEAFKVNVAKMRVQMPPQIREEVRQAVSPVLKLAREVYDRKESSARPPWSQQTANDSTATYETKHPATATGHSPSPPMLTLKQWSDRTLKAATSRERPVVKAVLKRLRRQQAESS